MSLYLPTAFTLRIMHSVNTVYSCVICYSHYEQRLLPCTALNSFSINWSQAALYKLEAHFLEVNQFSFPLKQTEK
jgi:hypothetical protein